MSKKSEKKAKAKTKARVKVTRGRGLLERYLAKKRSKVADRLIPPSCRSGRLLDIGCGNYPYFLVNTTFAFKYGLDKSIDVAGLKGALGESFRVGNWDSREEDRLPFGDGYFDVVTMLAVFEHIEVGKIDRLAAEVKRVLKGGGYFILTIPAGWTDKLLRILASARLVSAEEIADHKDTYTPRKITDILERGGFKKVKVGKFEWGMNIWGAAQK